MSQDLSNYLIQFITIFVEYMLMLFVVSLWHIFEKAGKPGWKSVIPVYNIIIILDIIKKPRNWLWLFLIPVVNVVIVIIICIELAKKFGKSKTFGGLGLAFLSLIFFPILAFSDSKYSDEDVDISNSKVSIFGVLLTAFIFYVIQIREIKIKKIN